MKKYNFDIEITDSKEVAGGYLLTAKNKTEKQVAAEMEKIGRELLKYNPQIEKVWYSAWEEGAEDLSNCAHVMIALYRRGRKIEVLNFD